ncbi:MAG: fumarylacetoacetate hydrolase family protein [Hyphomicrobiales bacterium]
MIFGCEHLVWYCSQFFVMEPGDIIITGTPLGVALGMKPTPVFLKRRRSKSSKKTAAKKPRGSHPGFFMRETFAAHPITPGDQPETPVAYRSLRALL